MDPEKTSIIIFTRGHRIEGDIDLISGARLTDFINTAKAFIAVTNAKIADRTGAEIKRADFINVAVAAVEIILPAGDVA